MRVVFVVVVILGVYWVELLSVSWVLVSVFVSFMCVVRFVCFVRMVFLDWIRLIILVVVVVGVILVVYWVRVVN